MSALTDFIDQKGIVNQSMGIKDGERFSHIYVTFSAEDLKVLDKSFELVSKGKLEELCPQCQSPLNKDYDCDECLYKS